MASAKKFKRITLANLPYSSAQQVFDHVANHLLKQKEQSTRPDGCAYRSSGEKTLMCAAGACMTDAEYERIKGAKVYKSSPQRGIEGRLWDTLVSAKVVPPQHKNLIGDLQRIHDHEAVVDWRLKLANLAKHLGLKWNHGRVQKPRSGVFSRA